MGEVIPPERSEVMRPNGVTDVLWGAQRGVQIGDAGHRPSFTFTDYLVLVPLYCPAGGSVVGLVVHRVYAK